MEDPSTTTTASESAARRRFRLAKVARVGDTLALARGEGYTLDIDAKAPLYQGAHAEVFWDGERIANAPLDQGHLRVQRFAATNGYLRVHIVSGAGVPLAVTNPIWIRTAVR